LTTIGVNSALTKCQFVVGGAPRELSS